MIEEKYARLRKAVAFVELGAKLDAATWGSIALSILVGCPHRDMLFASISGYDVFKV